MKPKTWLLLPIVVCVLLAATFRVCARSQAGIHSCDLPEGRNLFRDGRLLASNQCHSRAVYDSESGLANACMINPSSPPLFRAAELASDDEDQAGDSLPDDKDMKFASLKPCLRVAEWRSNRPDTQRANSFINSKTKPPP